MPTLSKDTTPEQVYEMLRAVEADGMIRYIVPTKPLGDWVLGVDDDQLLKLDHEQVIAFLIGHQMTLHWMMSRLADHGASVPPWMNGTEARATAAVLREVGKAPTQHPTWRIKELLAKAADMLDQR